MSSSKQWDSDILDYAETSCSQRMKRRKLRNTSEKLWTAVVVTGRED
jgi:hypothetical protein